MPTYEITITAKVIILAENVAQANKLAQEESVRVIGSCIGITGKTKHDRNKYHYQRTVWGMTKSLPTRIIH